MLAKAQIQRLVHNSKTNRALDGNLLPLNNNDCFLNLEGVSSVTVVEDDPKGALPVAFGLFNQCTPNQVYCSIVAVAPRYENNFVSAERVKCKSGIPLGLPLDCDIDHHSLLKLTGTMPQLPDLSGLPQYFSAFAEPVARPLLTCVVDQLIEQTVGLGNVEMRRNLTVDLYDAQAGLSEHSDVLWRDFSGFVVADRFQYREITIQRSNLVDTLKRATEGISREIAVQEGQGLAYRLESVTMQNLALVLEFDRSVALMDRADYLEYLTKLSGISGVIAIDPQNQPLGYCLALNDRILQCYAENKDVANHLLLEQAEKKIDSHQISMFVSLGQDWLAETLVQEALQVRRVRRFHTRILPSNVKWPKVFALNIGVHLF